MPDFTSALYLGLRHPGGVLPAGTALSSGRPAALQTPRAVHRIESEIARLAGTDAACIGRSTLHLYNDLVGGHTVPHQWLLLDAGCYPIAHWAAQRARGRGVRCAQLPHYRPEAAAEWLAHRQSGTAATLLLDAVDTETGQIAPLADYLEIACRYHAWVVVDDSQALGILGSGPTPANPFGRDGGGSLCWHAQAGHRRCVLVSSLAKAFGAPLAVLCGTRSRVEEFRRRAQSLVHTSPPVLPVLHAAARALRVNAEDGEARRRHLLRLIRRLRCGLRNLGYWPVGGCHPIQGLGTMSPDMAMRLHRALHEQGSEILLRQGRCGVLPSVVLRADHPVEAIDLLLDQIRKAQGYLVKRDV